MPAGLDGGGNADGPASSDEPEKRDGPQVYHRVETPSQTAAVARMQEQSGEIWGQPAQNSNLACVKAYFGSLPKGRRGIEFTTPIPHDPRFGDPVEARWYYNFTAGVQVNGQGFAFIPATVTNKQVP